jgi:hypothetical protein
MQTWYRSHVDGFSLRAAAIRWVRAVDRLELLVTALAILAGPFAATDAGSLGAAVHEARGSTYASASQIRRRAISAAAGTSIETRANARWRLRVGPKPADIRRVIQAIQARRLAVKAAYDADNSFHISFPISPAPTPSGAKTVQRNATQAEDTTAELS